MANCDIESNWQIAHGRNLIHHMIFFIVCKLKNGLEFVNLSPDNV